MTLEEHKQIHIKLHQSLSELAYDFHKVTSRPLDTVSFKELFSWSLSQTQNPTSQSQAVDSIKAIELASKEEERPPLNENENEIFPISHSQTNSPTPSRGKKTRRTRA